MQAHGDAYCEAVVGDLLKAADFACAFLRVGEGLAAEQADHGRAQNQRDVHVGLGGSDLIAEFFIAADKVPTGSQVADGKTLFNAGEFGLDEVVRL